MKRGILVAALVTTVAGFASANLLTTADATSPSPTGPTLQAQATPVTATPAKAASSQNATVEAQQTPAPVPFRMKPRPPVNVPAVEDRATEAKPADKPAETSPDSAGDAAAESAARAAIEADGYKSVKVLRRGANGVWHASGLRGKTAVMLTVDANGSVSAD